MSAPWLPNHWMNEIAASIDGARIGVSAISRNTALAAHAAAGQGVREGERERYGDQRHQRGDEQRVAGGVDERRRGDVLAELRESDERAAAVLDALGEDGDSGASRNSASAAHAATSSARAIASLAVDDARRA